MFSYRFNTYNKRLSALWQFEHNAGGLFAAWTIRTTIERLYNVVRVTIINA